MLATTALYINCTSVACNHQKKLLDVIRSEPSPVILNTSISSLERISLSQYLPSFSVQTLFQHMVNHPIGKQTALQKLSPELCYISEIQLPGMEVANDKKFSFCLWDKKRRKPTQSWSATDLEVQLNTLGILK